MKPSPSKVRIAKETRTDHESALEQGGFAEVRAKGSSLEEACAKLRRDLAQGVGGASGNLPNLDLDQAIEDLEAFARLSTSEGTIAVSFDDKVFLKRNDIVYQISVGIYYGGPPDTSDGPRDHASSHPDPPEEIVIYAVGRRVSDRRRAECGEKPDSAKTERRKTDRRLEERRDGRRYTKVHRSEMSEHHRAAKGVARGDRPIVSLGQ